MQCLGINACTGSLKAHGRRGKRTMETKLVDVALLAKVFRAAAKGSLQAAWTPGHGSTGDYRDIAKANAGAFSGVADLFEKLAADSADGGNNG
jgi:hypothetical protein